MEEEYKITTGKEDFVDFKQNAQDISDAVYRATTKEPRIGVAFAVYLYDPDMMTPEHEKWSVASFIPVTKDLPDEMKAKMLKSFQYIGEQVKIILLGGDAQPLRRPTQ